MDAGPSRAAPQPQPSQFEVWIPRALAALAGVPVVMGVIAELLETGTGNSFTLGDAAYFVGLAALGAWFGFLVGIFVGGAVQALLRAVFGVDEDQAGNVGIAIIAVAAGLCAVIAPLGESPPDGGEGAELRILGILTVVGASIAYAAFKGSRSTGS